VQLHFSQEHLHKRRTFCYVIEMICSDSCTLIDMILIYGYSSVISKPAIYILVDKQIPHLSFSHNHKDLCSSIGFSNLHLSN